MIETPRLTREEFRPGFDWVARELVLPAQHLEEVFEVVHAWLYDGIERRLKALRAVWPEKAQWPSGQAYLQESLRQELEEEDEWRDGDPLPEVSDRAIFVLLLVRFAHIAQRIYRNDQLQNLLADAHLSKRFAHIEMNRYPCEEHALCGRASNVLLPINEGRELMKQLACPHPACRCTFDLLKRGS